MASIVIWKNGTVVRRNDGSVKVVPPFEPLAVRTVSPRFLSEQERIQIADLASRGHGPTAIGQTLGRSPSTIINKLRRNLHPSGQYRPFHAHAAAATRRRRTHHRESTESWLDLLRSCKRRGMRAPVLAVGDGALGFWAAVREVFPEAREQRCWFHKIANVLNALPKSAQPGAKAALAEIWNAEDKSHAKAAAKAFAAEYGAKWPKAAAKITDDLDVLLAFYDYPAEHWIHLRTTNPIESTFATVRLRQRVTKGPGSRAAGVAMAFKLIESAQARWRAVNAPHLVALVRAGATFKNGKLVERDDDKGAAA